MATVDHLGPPGGVTIEILRERASSRPKAGQQELCRGPATVSFEELQKGLTVVDRQGGAAVPTKDGAARTDELGEAVTLRTGKGGNPQAMPAERLRSLSGWSMCLLPVSPRAPPPSSSKDT